MKASDEAKRKAREETATPVVQKRPKKTGTDTAAREATDKRSKFIIKTKLESMPRDEFNADQKRAFINEIQRIVRHVSDVTYAASAFLNWYCLRRLRNGEAIEKLTHKRLYNFAALFVGQGKKAEVEISEAFRAFTTTMGETFNRQVQFPNIQYTTILTIVMRSFQTLIENHVGMNFKRRTLRYLFTRLCDPTEFPGLPFSTGAKRGLAERVYNAIRTGDAMIYPQNMEIAEVYQVSINNLIAECRQRLNGLRMTDADFYANPHSYLPWLYHVLERMEQHHIIREPVPQNQVRIGYVHRQLGEIVDFRRLPRRFRRTLDKHVCNAINLENPTIPRFADHEFRTNLYRRSQAADPFQRAQLNDLLHDEKVAIDEFVARTKNEVAQQLFRPEQYTDLRGARIFTLLSV